MKICVWTTFEKQNLHILYDENGSGILCNDVRLTIPKKPTTTATTKTTTTTTTTTTKTKKQQKQQKKTTTTTTTTMVVKVLDGQRCMCLANEGYD